MQLNNFIRDAVNVVLWDTIGEYVRSWKLGSGLSGHRELMVIFLPELITSSAKSSYGWKMSCMSQRHDEIFGFLKNSSSSITIWADISVFELMFTVMSTYLVPTQGFYVVLGRCQRSDDSSCSWRHPSKLASQGIDMPDMSLGWLPT